ncbi:MAG TPA: aldo/keto reductase [Planctomycetota bacterium]|nr:aldo/keto reductase [Planctomycetota bacterium]
MIAGKATPQGSASYAAKHPGLHAGHWRSALGLKLSSIGLGTYLGNADPVTDGKYASAVGKALSVGLNVLDTAANYRYQRSERSVGAGLRKAIEEGIVARDEVVLCSKGGFIPGDWGPPTREWFEETYLKGGLLGAGDVVEPGHSMAPKFLRHEVEQSLKNLGVETIDVYYVHNPETQLPVVGPDDYYTRLTEAFRALEECAREGKIQWYGTATWHAYRVPPGTEAAVSLEKTVACARSAGGENHRFRVIQLPFNLAMPEASLAATQERGGGAVSALAAAEALGLAVLSSVPLMQSKLLGRFSKDFRAKFPGLETDAQRCLQFVRSTPGIAAPLAGMKTLEHVVENAKVAALPPLTPDEYAGVLSLLGAA